VEWRNTLETITLAWGLLATIGVFVGTVLVWTLVGYSRVRFAVRLISCLHNTLGEHPGPKIKRLAESIAVAEIRRLLIESTLGLSIFVCSKDGRLKDGNENLADLFGIDRSGLLGFGWLDAVCPDDRERVHEQWMYAVRNGLPYECEYTVKNRRQSNSEYIVVARAYPVQTPNGEVEYFVGSIKKFNGQEESSIGSIG